MRKTHIIFSYTFSEKFTKFDYDVVGAFTSLERAKNALKHLPPETENLVYDILSVPINKIMDGKKRQPVDLFSFGSEGTVLEGLVRQGLVEPLIGEDGEFYFILTEEGKKLAEERKKKK
jgi:hypothetical protein